MCLKLGNSRSEALAFMNKFDTHFREQPRIRRKVSRVESLKRIIFSRSAGAFDDKKRRSKSAETEIMKRNTVDKESDIVFL